MNIIELRLRKILLDIYWLTETVMYNFIIQSKALRYQHCIVGGGTPGTHLDIIVDNERSNEERRLKNICYSIYSRGIEITI